MKKNEHITVLKAEAVEALAIKNSSIIVDATFGSGGHAQEIISRLGPKGTFVGIDADPVAVTRGKALLKSAKCTTHICEGNFRSIDSIFSELHIGKADGILADLGWRMEQFSGNGKGFSFQVDEPLIMTFGDPNKYPFVASDILNTWKEEDIKNVLKGYGEERFAGRIARNIVERRIEKEFETTFELVQTITNAVPSFYRRGKIHPATRTFQALRIAVNDEFEALEQFISRSIACLSPRGRLAIITFHSLEDRIVKHCFKNFSHDHGGLVITKKPISATEQERRENPRSRSAKLRVFEKDETT